MVTQNCQRLVGGINISFHLSEFKIRPHGHSLNSHLDENLKTYKLTCSLLTCFVRMLHYMYVLMVRIRRKSTCISLEYWQR
jgi:hypothetical protein